MNILVRAPNWLGDIVMALPAIATIRRHFPDASLTVAAPPAFAPLCAAAPGVDAAIALPKGRGRAARQERARVIQAGGFELGLLLTNSFGSALDLWRAGVPERWGYRADWRGRLLTRAIERPRRRGRDARPALDADATASAQPQPPDAASAVERTNSTDAAPRGRHHSEYYLALTTALGMAPLRATPPLRVGRDTAARARDLLVEAGWDGQAPLVAIAPGAAYGFAKRWPPERMAAVVDRLAARGLFAVLVGAPTDRASARAVESALATALVAGGASAAETRSGTGRTDAGRCLNVVGRTDLPTLMALLGACAAVLSNDSGAMHLASAVGRPVVAVFGPTDDVATAPLGRHVIVTHDVWCRPCLLRECPIDHRCMRGVSPDTVLAALLTMIAPAA